MLTVEQIQELNWRMLGLGAPIDRDGVGYNKPDFVSMQYIGRLSVKLSFLEAYVCLETLLGYKNTQLTGYKDELEQTMKAYEEQFATLYPKSDEEKYADGVMGLYGARKASNHSKKDFRHDELIYLGSRQDSGRHNAVLMFDKYVENVNLRPYEGRWTKVDGKSAMLIPFNRLEEFLEYAATLGKYGYGAPEELLNALTQYQQGLISEANESPAEKKVHFISLNMKNAYGYDLYRLDQNDYDFNQKLWELKGRGISYVDSKSNAESVTISTKDKMLPVLLEFLKAEGVDVSTVEEAYETRKNYVPPDPSELNKSGNTLLDVSALRLPFQPYDFQLADAAEVVGRKKALMGHDMGCGKTFIAALVGMSLPGKKLVICPETLRLNWQRELELTAGVNQGATIHIVYSKDKKPNFDSEWTILGYRTAVKFLGYLLKEEFRTLFVDEAHKAKAVTNYGEPGSKQADAVLRLSRKIPYTYLLTGTPMPTRNKDLYNMFRILGEIDTSVKYAFHRYGLEFCNAYNDGYGWNYEGSSNSSTLHEKLAKYMTRRLKSDVLPNLTKQRIPILIESTLSREYKKTEAELHHCSADDKTFMALAMTGRRQLSMCKVDSAIEFADTIIEGGESVVLVAEFNDTLDRMMEHYKENACCIRGGMSDSAKQKAIDEFQSGEKKVCCINLIAAGVGITLTKAHTMVICDYDWTPANMTQVEDRICRTGQGEHCNIFYICHQKAILDQIFLQMITDKSSNIDRVVDAAANTVDLISMKRSDPAGEAKNSFLAALKARILKENEKGEEIVDKDGKGAKMSQTGVFVYINGNLAEEVFPAIPDHEEMIQICRDEGYSASDGQYPGDYLTVEYEKVEIGSGEYGADSTWDDSEMHYLYSVRNQPDCPAEVTTVDEGRDDVDYDELDPYSADESEENDEGADLEEKSKNRFHL